MRMKCYLNHPFADVTAPTSTNPLLLSSKPAHDLEDGGAELSTSAVSSSQIMCMWPLFFQLLQGSGEEKLADKEINS